MASGTGGTSQLREVAAQLRERLEARSRRVGHLLWRLVVTTAGACLRYRVTGLAAEAAFFAVLSVPPLIFALAGGVGYVSDQFSPAQVEDVRRAILEVSSRLLTERAVTTSSPRPSTTSSRAAASTSSRWASCWRSGRDRGR